MKIPHLNSRSSKRGFTLVELVLVITIISILVGGGIYYMMGNVDVAKEVKAETDIKALTTQLQVYASRNLRTPTTEQGLRALVERPESEPAPENWTQLLEEVLKDPWGKTYQYKIPAERSKKGYDLYSLGPDGIESEDDIGNWRRKTPDSQEG
ncbi:MAG: general secretion pathway protein G [Verrucomicrobiales bacterium]|jgi:general secretion pathway protein G